MPRLSTPNAMGVSTNQHLTLSLIGGAPAWHGDGQCRHAGVEMVPGSLENHANRGPAVQAAKEVCIGCPVLQKCLAYGKSFPGIWGGLTLDERERIRVSRHQRTRKSVQVREVVECSVCLLDCVPRMRHIPKCDTCLPDEERPQSPEAHKAQIIKLISDGKTYKEIAEHPELVRFGLKAEAIGKACRRWGTPSKVKVRRGRSAQVLALPSRRQAPAARAA